MLDRFSAGLGKASSWLTLLMVLVTFAVVVMRYVFDIGFIWLQETVVWMHACVFMVGAAYTLQQEQHVRVDIFYRDMSDTRRAWVDVLGVIFFLLPVCAFLGWAAFDFVLVSWRLNEASREAGGLPYPLIPLLKSIIIVMPITLGLQGLSLFLKSFKTLRTS
jgi:TRAP-type mannitol/chloroaromatic compound transport system permease small subunit